VWFSSPIFCSALFFEITLLFEIILVTSYIGECKLFGADYLSLFKISECQSNISSLNKVTGLLEFSLDL
jgi:hypothetical protein